MIIVVVIVVVVVVVAVVVVVIIIYLSTHAAHFTLIFDILREKRKLLINGNRSHPDRVSDGYLLPLDWRSALINN